MKRLFTRHESQSLNTIYKIQKVPGLGVHRDESMAVNDSTRIEPHTLKNRTNDNIRLRGKRAT